MSTVSQPLITELPIVSMGKITDELPAGLEIHQVSDQPSVVQQSIGEFVSTLREAIIIVLIVSFLSLGVRTGMGFFVAAACAYMAGLVGTSSSPISGIGILGIIVSSLVMLALCNQFGIFDMPNGSKFATAIAIFTTSIILSIACISNDNM